MTWDRIKEFYKENLTPIETPQEGKAEEKQPVGDQNQVADNSSYMGYQVQQSQTDGPSSGGDEQGPVLKPELPTAGASIVGYGDQFQVDGFTGGASLSFGGQSYNTGSGNGPFGMGFGNGGMGEISRRTSHGIPTYDDDEDQFLWNGQVLVSLLENKSDVILRGSLGDIQVDGVTWKQMIVDESVGPYKVRVYLPMEEQSYSKIRYWKWDSTDNQQDNPGSFWEILAPDNSIQLFGVDNEAQVYDPGDPDKIFKWLLQETLDGQGHSTYITYKRENAYGLDEHDVYEHNREQTAQLYVQQVATGQNTPIPEPLSLLPSANRDEVTPNWFFFTVYDYGEYDLSVDNLDPYTPTQEWSLRKDSFSTFFGGFEVRNHRLCHQVLQFHQFEELGSVPVLTHVSDYFYEPSPVCTLMVASAERGFYLNKEKNVYEVKHSVPIEMEYTAFEPQGRTYKPMLRKYDNGVEDFFSSIGPGLDFITVDLYSEGIEGLLHSDGVGTDFYYFQTDAASVKADSEAIVYQRSQKGYDVPDNQLSSDQFHSFQDITGNGQLDYVVQRDAVMGYFEAGENGLWKEFKPLPTYATELYNPRVKLVNVCGDGRSDCLMVMNGKTRYYKNDGEKGFRAGVNVESSTLPANIESSEDTLFMFAGIAGDGKSHLMKVTYDGLTYWPNYGYGEFGKPISMGNFPELTYEEFKTNRIFFADVDGTGTADMLILSSTGIKLYLNQSGNTFSDVIHLELPPNEQYDDNDKILFADVYGIGMSSLIYCKTHPTSKQWVYDFSGGIKPYLMTSHINNIGARSTLEFKSSVHYYLEDKEGNPWATHAPFPSWTLNKMILEDAISGSTLSQSYRYRDSYYDGVEREFRGYGYVEHIDADSFNSKDPILDSPPSVLKSWFHTGNPNQEEVVLKYIAEEYFDGDKFAQTLQSEAYEPRQMFDDEELMRQASILMKGTLLHSELYGEDGGPDHEYPFQVENSNATIRLLQLKEDNYYASFERLERESLVYNYERDPSDPKMSYGAALRFEFGQSTQECSIIYGRRDDGDSYIVPDDPTLEEQQKEVRCYSNVSRLYHFDSAKKLGQDDDQLYMLNVPYEGLGFVITNLEEVLGSETLENGGIYDYENIMDILSAQDPASNIPFAADVVYIQHEWNRNWYQYPLSDDSDLTQITGYQIYTIGLKRPGNRGFMLPYYEESVAYNQESLYKSLDAFFSEDELQDQMATTGKYLSEEGYWWLSSGEYFYYKAEKFYQLHKYKNPMGEVSTLDYDQHNLLNVWGQDPLQNVTQVPKNIDGAYEIDYQVLHPFAIEDPNGNRSEVKFDALGRVIATTHYGGEMEVNNFNEEQTYNSDAGFDSLYGLDNQNNPYVVRDTELDTIKVILADPMYYLQNAQSFVFYAPFSWMGTVPFDEYIEKSRGSNRKLLEEFFRLLQKNGLMNGEGAIFHRFRNIIRTCENDDDFSKALGLLSDELQEVFEALKGKNKKKAFEIFNDIEDAQPVHILAMSADDYPYKTNAILSKDDYYAHVTDITEEQLDDWWTVLVDQELMKIHGAFDPDLRSIIQQSQTYSDFEKNLGEYSKKAEQVFDNFSKNDPDQRQEVFELLRKALYQRIKQAVGYNDGFGRALQSKIKSEDRTDCYIYENGEVSSNDGTLRAHIWLTEGLTVYNNKAQVVRQYDPFFINTVDFIYNDDLYRVGTSPTSYYDALGRATHVITRKGFLKYHSWSAWGYTVWDANDLLMISPYYIVNEKNIFNESTAKPSEQNPYSEYYDEGMTESDRTALKKAMILAWTPGLSITDNRSIPWRESTTNSGQYTIESMTIYPLEFSYEEASNLFDELLTIGYLERFDSYKTIEIKDEEGEVIDVGQVDVKWGDLTPLFPLRTIVNEMIVSTDGEWYDFNLKYKAQIPKILSLLFDYKLHGNFLVANEMYNAFFTAFGSSPYDKEDCVSLWNALNKAGILDDQGIVTNQIYFPKLNLESFQDYNDAIVNYIVRIYAGGGLYTNHMVYDDLNRVQTIADPRLSENGFVNLTYIYPDAYGPSVSVISCDAGQSWQLSNVLGRSMWQMDPRNVKMEVFYDALIRPVNTQVSLVDEPGWGPLCVSRIEYGESVFADEDGTYELTQQYNYRLKPVQAFTQGGWGSVAFGFNILGMPNGGMNRFTKAYAPPEGDYSVAQPIIEVTILNSNPKTPPENASELLKSDLYQAFSWFDAANELVLLQDPADNKHYPVFYQEGGMKRFRINQVDYMNNIQYNAKMQHLSTDYHNEEGERMLTTYYAYDPKNYRLTQIHTESADGERLQRDTEYAAIVQETDHVRQNLLYTLDPIGNVAEVSGYYQAPEEENENKLRQFPVAGEYTYDALYRLVEASGYEEENNEETQNE